MRNIYFQSLAGNQPNPICTNNSYRMNIFELLTTLKRLDGIKLFKFRNSKKCIVEQWIIAGKKK